LVNTYSPGNASGKDSPTEKDVLYEFVENKFENDGLARILVQFYLSSLVEPYRQIYPALFVIRNLNLEWK
jgi:hypothetical protein